MAIANFGNLHYTLQNGINMPAVGLGTYRLHNQEIVYRAVEYALAAGYRLFDTAPDYENEQFLREAFKILLPKYGLTRKQLFITSKLTLIPKGGRYISKAFEKSLQNLGLDYIDLYLIHFPAPPHANKRYKNESIRAETWMALVKLYNESKVHAIGVSNFTIRHLMQLTEIMALGPMVNQVEWHPYYFQLDMLQYCCEHNIRLQAYSSFGGLSRGNRALLQEPILKKLSEEYAASSAQILLTWALQRGIAVIPKAQTICQLQENRNLKIRLCEKDIKALDALGIKNKKYAWDPSGIA